MRVAVFISAIVATLLLVSASAMVFYFVAGETAGIIGSAGSGLLVYGALLLGSASAYWHTRSADSRKPVRRWIVVVAVMDALGAALVITATVLSGGPVWLPVVVILAGLVLVVVAVAVGRFVLKRESAGQPIQPVWDRAVLIRKIRLVVIVFLAVLLVGAVVFGALLGGRELLVAALFALTFACICAAVVAILSGRSLWMQLRDAANRDLGLVHKLSRVVLKAKDEPLDDEEKQAAARYASIAPTALGFQLGGFALLYIGLALQRVEALITRPQPFDWILLGLLVGLFVVVAPISIRQIRRSRTYAAAHPQPVEP